MSDSQSVSKAAHQIVIIEANCKGCAICVEFCPTKVLGLRRGKVVVLNPEKCTGCQLCDLRCPDFAITVDNPHADKLRSKA